MFILGIDGGGTHTRLELRTAEDAFLRRAEAGAFNMAVLGEDGFRARLREIFALCGDMTQCASVCIGGAGISGGAMEPVIRDELLSSDFQGKLLLCGDHEIALAGALEEPGCILISGTGSICCGRNSVGAFARSGGLGHIMDDGGSGYWLGREALRRTARALDGRAPQTALTHAVLEYTKARDARELVHYVYYSAKGKSHIAMVCKAVIRCAEAGDAESLSILQAGAAELRELAQAVCTELGLTHPPIATMGGLLEEDGIYRRLVCDALEGLVRPVYAASDALRGASLLAYRNYIER